MSLVPCLASLRTGGSNQVQSVVDMVVLGAVVAANLGPETSIDLFCLLPSMASFRAGSLRRRRKVSSDKTNG